MDEILYALAQGRTIIALLKFDYKIIGKSNTWRQKEVPLTNESTSGSAM